MASRGIVLSSILALAGLASARGNCSATLDVDVAVIGGGASGAYAAAQLVDVYNKTVVVVEQQAKLGGHANTAAVPLPDGTTTAVDYGAMAYLNLTGVSDFFARYGVKLVPATMTLEVPTYAVDFETGKNVTLPASNPEETSAAIQKWIGICQQYWSLLYPAFAPGVGEIEDLTMPFGEFVTKHDLQALMPMMTNWIWRIDLLTTPTMYVMTTAGPLQVLAGQPGVPYAFHIPESHNNSEVYANIRQHLGSRVLLNSKVQSATRGDASTTLTISTPEGLKHVRAKRLIVATPPILENMAPLGLDAEEQALFGSYVTDNVFPMLVTGTGLPDATVKNYNASAPEKFYLPEGEFINAFSSYVPGLHHVSALGNNVDLARAKEMVAEALRQIRDGGAFPSARDEPVFLGAADHTPGLVTQPTEELKAGVMGRLLALQGKKGTWFVGGSWTTDLTATVWVQAQGILEEMLKEEF